MSSDEFSKGIAICTYNRAANLPAVLDHVLANKPEDARVVVCDDGSFDDTSIVMQRYPNVTYIKGPNQGVGANKNRALFALRNCDFLCILEDDLVPTVPGWFERYMEFVLNTNIHHICRVQDKRVPEAVPDFGSWCKEVLNMTPIYGPSPRGDLTFITNTVLRRVGAIHPDFKGVGHAHGQWSARIAASGLIGHPNNWIDIEEISSTFEQIGDTVGGRWNDNKEAMKEQIAANSLLRKQLGVDPLYVELFLP